jgi:hypothetical protein
MSILKNFLMKPCQLIFLIILIYIKELLISALSGIEIYPLVKSIFDLDVKRLNLDYPITEKLIIEFTK